MIGNKPPSLRGAFFFSHPAAYPWVICIFSFTLPFCFNWLVHKKEVDTDLYLCTRGARTPRQGFKQNRHLRESSVLELQPSFFMLRVPEKPLQMDETKGGFQQTWQLICIAVAGVALWVRLKKHETIVRIVLFLRPAPRPDGASCLVSWERHEHDLCWVFSDERNGVVPIYK